MTAPFNRRQFLRGLGTAIAIPALESMLPASAAAAAKAGRATPGLTASGQPLRMAFIYTPNGKNMKLWRPSMFGEGSKFELSPTLEPLAAYKAKLQVLAGLDHDKAEANGDGGGDHARANATFLTGCQAKKTAGADIRAGKSVDQIAADIYGTQTKLSSLELSCDAARGSGSCDSGYSCAYQFNLSWRTENTPMAPEVNPRLVFERLFGGGDRKESAEARTRRLRYEKSILDFALADAKSLQRRLGATDRRKMDEFLNSVREVERRVENAEKFAKSMPDAKIPEGIPDTYREHIRLMFDLMALAFQTDTTRISTFLMAHDGSNRSFPDFGVRSGHHEISHHQSNEEKLAGIAKIDRFYSEEWAYFLQKLDSAKDPDGKSVLDNSMIVFGAGMSDPNRHNHHDLPMILAGGGGGQLKPDRHVEFRDHTPVTNLYLAMLERAGVQAERIGDSTGVIENI